MKHLDLQIKDFGQQFTEQVKCLESKVVVDSSILSNILDLYKRRAAIEQEYSDNLLKLSSSIAQRNNLENLKRPKWKNYSPVKVLNSLLASTDHTAKSHKNLGDIYGKQMTQRIMDIQDDCSRLTKRSTDILQRRHTEILKSVNQLLMKHKNYVKLFNEADDCRRKADKAMEQLDREVIRCQDKKREFDKNPKIKKFKDEYTEKYKFFKDKQIESTAARNKYIIHLVSLKDAVDHFYNYELSTIIQCSQYGFHNNLTRLSMNHGSCEDALITVHNSISKLFSSTIDHIDATNDTEVFFDVHKSIFTLKEQLHFNPAKDDNINKIMKTDQRVENELQNMHVKFDTDMKNISKFLVDKKQYIDVISNCYNDLINQSDYDVVDFICNQQQTDQTVKEKTTSLSRDNVIENLYSSIQRRIKEPKLIKETAYFKLMEDYLNDQINQVNVSTKLKNVEAVLSSPTDDCDSQYVRKTIQQQTAVIIGIKSKLFGGDLKKYSWDTKEIVPIIVRSCIRLINIYGMRNIGVFRVPGSQVDVQNFKAQFELGLNPVKDLPGSPNDVNLAASLLKLYFRELDPPVFDDVMFMKIVDRYNIVKQKEDAIVAFMKEIVSTLDPAVYATVIYLVSFVNHLSEFSSENCMDIQNLAIIFGPCLMPIPEEQNNQLFHYQSIINHVAQCLITHHDEIFIRPSEGPTYQRNQNSAASDDNSYIEPSSAVESDRSAFFDDSLTSSIEEDCKNMKRNESVRYIRPRPLDSILRIRRNSDSERNQNLTAVAIANYTAKLEQEVSLVVGDSILLKKKINDEWWSGTITNKVPAVRGVIPVAYIRLTSQGEKVSETDIDLKQADSDISPGETRNMVDKGNSVKKTSLVSCDSDNDLEFSSRNGTGQNNISTENTTECSDTGESKSLGSIDNIADIDAIEEVLKTELLNLKESTDSIDKDSGFVLNTKECDEKIDKENVKIRTASLGRCVDAGETMDLVDDDLRQTMQGLQKIEQINVRKHRDTIHIDKSMLASKFISPLRPDPFQFLAKDFSGVSRVVQSEERPMSSQSCDFKLKRPGNVSSLASSFEMSTGPRVMQPRLYDSAGRAHSSDDQLSTPPSVPPPTFPKPKINKK